MKMEWIGNAIAVAWVLTCLLGCCLGIAHFVLYYKDLKWQREKYLWEYIDKKYDVLLVEKESNDEKA
jgi:hypothetical protein